MSRHLLPPSKPPGEPRPEPQHIVPYVLADDVTPEQALMVPNLDGAPSLLAFLGKGAGGRKLAAVVFERPQHFRFRRAKVTVEEHQLERFLSDHRRATGGAPFDSFRRGSDPPDFYVTDGESESGLDATQLVLPERVAAHDAFKRLRSAVIGLGPNRFRHLRGHVVYVGLDEKGQKRIGGWVDRVLEALQGLVEPLPAPVPKRGDDGSIEQELVEKHDKPHTQFLLIPVGAPLAAGEGFFSDIIPLGLAQEAGRIVAAMHIRVIYVHVWQTRWILAIRPGTAEWDEVAPAESPFEGYATGFGLVPVVLGDADAPV